MNTLFFWTSKLIWAVISPDNLFVILVLLTWWKLWRHLRGTARWVLECLAFLLIVTAWFPVGEWLVYPLETQFPSNAPLPEHVDGIIVLGGAEETLASSYWKQAELTESAERLTAFLELARRYPDARLVYSGGTGSMVYRNDTGADVARRLFLSQGLDLSRVQFESRSRNTYENATLSKALLKPMPFEKWVLITSAWHMPRAVGIFCKAGWPVIPYPVDHLSIPGRLFRVDFNFSDHLRVLRTAVREWIGLIAYDITGKTTALLPEGCMSQK